MGFLRIFRSVNWKRILVLLIFAPFIVVDSHILAYWAGYARGRKSRLAVIEKGNKEIARETRLKIKVG